MNRLLSVDWDFFFPVPEHDYEGLYDWGHREDLALMYNEIWTVRAAGFLRAHKPLPQTSGDEQTFWQKFRFTPEATLFYADSHSQAARPEVQGGIDELWSFDAHHDAYNSVRHVIKEKVIHCGNWLVAYHMNTVKIKVFYPRWREWALKEDKPKISIPMELDPQNRRPFRKPFDRVFLCRSGAWTPTWLEDKFWEFFDACPVPNKVSIDNMERRVYRQEEVEQMAKAFDEHMKA